jgi:hypothetical protein
MSPRHIHLIATCSSLVAFGCGDAGRLDTACTSNSECASTELCATNFCGGIGMCVAREETCDDTVVDLVCGCDGLTYQSACFANMAGIRLAATEGPCACSDNSECVTGQFCALDNSCFNRGGCLPIPETCDPADTQQACACDGVTYDNECTAFQSGVRVSALGTCDCMDNTECAADEYCNALVCDGPGVCEARQGSCTPEGPATGCNGVVYESACDAAAAGVRVRPED